VFALKRPLEQRWLLKTGKRIAYFDANRSAENSNARPLTGRPQKNPSIDLPILSQRAALEDANRHGAHTILRYRDQLTLFGWDRGVAVDERAEYAAQRLDA
jgi:hypothetical protein